MWSAIGNKSGVNAINPAHRWDTCSWADVEKGEEKSVPKRFGRPLLVGLHECLRVMPFCYSPTPTKDNCSVRCVASIP